MAERGIASARGEKGGEGLREGGGVMKGGLRVRIWEGLLAQEFKELYDKCIIRDTPLGPDAVPPAYTVD